MLHLVGQLLIWISDARNHKHKVTIYIFLLQQWLHERASLLRYTYIVCLAECSNYEHGR